MEDFRNRIEALNDVQHAEIFKICRAHAIVFTENKNGVLIDVGKLTPACRTEIERYVEFSCAALSAE